jgi:hypothetical protein
LRLIKVSQTGIGKADSFQWPVDQPIEKAGIFGERNAEQQT